MIETKTAPSAEPAGVRVRKLEWKDPCRETNGCWVAESVFGSYSIAFDDGWHAELDEGRTWEWEPELDPRTYEGPSAAKAAAQADYERRVLSALEPTPEPAGDAVERGARAMCEYLGFDPYEPIRCEHTRLDAYRPVACAAIAAACPALQSENERLLLAIERAELQLLRWRDDGQAPAGWHAYDKAAKLLREMTETDNG